MVANGTLLWAALGMGISLVVLVYLLLGERRNRLDGRLRELAGKGGTEPDEDPVAQLARTALPRMGAVLLPKDEEDRSRLQTRLIHAGLYSRQAMVVFLGVKLLLMVGPPLLGLAAGVMHLVPTQHGVIFGALVGALGMIGPTFWLDRMKTRRQVSIRRGLPDALDVMVICLEGGVSLPAALRRVGTELRTAHPLLGQELAIVQREVHLGRSTGEALRQFADRCDLEEVRSLASVILQAERFGASLVKTLRVHAETLREKRLQYAEEMAQKAAVKVLFPTLFCIFPGLFIVILGPAAIQIMETFKK
jgi:tight adherence protein C